MKSATSPKEGGKPAETLMNVVALIAAALRDRCLFRVSARTRPRQSGSGSDARPAPGLHRHPAHGLHEGLAGLVAEQLRPVAVEHVKQSSPLQVLQRSRRRSLPIVPGGSADRPRRAAGSSGRANHRAARVSGGRDPHARGSRRAGSAGGQRSPHSGPVYRARPGAALVAGPQSLVELGSRLPPACFRDLDPVRWRQFNHNPIALL